MAFLVVCVADWSWDGCCGPGHRAGIALSFGLFPLELTFWIGFALPFGLLRTGCS